VLIVQLAELILVGIPEGAGLELMPLMSMARLAEAVAPAEAAAPASLESFTVH